jgi:uncharacterized delta-60 repeat protein
MTLDTSFGTDGIVLDDHAVVGNDEQANDIRVDGFGNIVATGFTSDSGMKDMALWRFNPDGTLDTTFSADGRVNHDAAAGEGGNDLAYGFAFDGQGNIIVSGYSASTAFNSDMAIWKYKPDGTLDTLFNGVGYYTEGNTSGYDGNESSRAVALDGFGNYVAVGVSQTASNHFVSTLWRFTSDGILDTSFDSDGIVTYDHPGPVPAYDTLYDVAIDGYGRIVAGGMVSNASTYDGVLLRFNSDGSLDTTFDSDGVMVIQDLNGNGGAYDAVYSIAINGKGEILAVGVTDDPPFMMFVAKITNSGMLDSNFGTGGYAFEKNNLDLTKAIYPQDIAIDDYGRILVSGFMPNDLDERVAFVARFTNTGTIDYTFTEDATGFLTYSGLGGGNLDQFSSVAVHNGSVLAAGYVLNSSNISDMLLVKINEVASPVNPGGDSGGGNGGSGGGCFIATAAYGSYGEKHVMELRAFRDNVLLKSKAGKAFVDAYYKYSPPVADFVAERPALRAATRLALAPVVYTVNYPAIALFALVLVPAGAITIRYRRKNR